MQTVAYFGHDVSDAAVRRRISALEQDGMRVIGFTKRRGEPTNPAWVNIDLGKTQDGALLKRFASIFTGAFRAWRARRGLKTADVIVARNLDMLASAMLANKISGAKLPVIYECLDVHRVMCRDDLVGSVLRKIEAWMMARTAGLMLSSPAFLTEYFEKYHGPQERVRLVENRMVPGMITHFQREETGPPETKNPNRIRIGWIGILRCNRSLDILCGLAKTFPNELSIELYGIPARLEVPDFEARIARHANINFHGRYKSPEDLQEIYNSVDLIWAIDFMEAGLNSKWLLPNRIYEGGYFGVPPITLRDTETARWVSRRHSGFVIGEPLAETTVTLIKTLLEQPELVGDKQLALSALGEDTFVQPEGFIRETVLALASL